MPRLGGTPWRFSGFNELSRHVDQRRFVASGGAEEALCCQFAAEMAATILGEIQIAEDGVRGSLGDEGERFVERGSTVHMQVASAEPLKEEAAQAFFVVQHENGATFQWVHRAGGHGARRKWGDRERSVGHLV